MLPEEDPKTVETIWALNSIVLITKLYIIILCTLLVLSYITFVTVSTTAIWCSPSWARKIQSSFSWPIPFIYTVIFSSYACYMPHLFPLIWSTLIIFSDKRNLDHLQQLIIIFLPFSFILFLMLVLSYIPFVTFPTTAIRCCPTWARKIQSNISWPIPLRYTLIFTTMHAKCPTYHLCLLWST